MFGQNGAGYFVLLYMDLALLCRKVARLMKSDDELIPTRRSLLTRLKDWDDREGWQRFFDTYWKLIYGTAIKLGLSDADAQEVVQETLIAVAKKMNDFKYDPALGSFKAWLLQLVRWRVTDRLRKQQREPARPAVPREDTSRTDTVLRLPDPATLNMDAVWEEEWQKNLYDAALRRVKEKASARQYQLFDLYVVKAWPVEEVMEALEVTADQVYQAKRRVSKLIRREVHDLETRMI
jgi:RNA polymerase sigma factor (sigma-70 family)